MINSNCQCDFYLIEVESTPFYECCICGLIYSKQVIDQREKEIERQLVETQEEEELEKERRKK